MVSYVRICVVMIDIIISIIQVISGVILYLTILSIISDMKQYHQYGCTALTYAAMSGHIEVVKMLLDRNANIEAVDDNVGRNVIMACTALCIIPIIMMMIIILIIILSITGAILYLTILSIISDMKQYH